MSQHQQQQEQHLLQPQLLQLQHKLRDLAPQKSRILLDALKTNLTYPSVNDSMKPLKNAK